MVPDGADGEDDASVGEGTVVEAAPAQAAEIKLTTVANASMRSRVLGSSLSAKRASFTTVDAALVIGGS